MVPAPKLVHTPLTDKCCAAPGWDKVDTASLPADLIDDPPPPKKI